MSAEAATPHPEMPRRRSRVVKSNRAQILLFPPDPAVDRGREHLKRHAAQDNLQDDK